MRPPRPAPDVMAALSAVQQLSDTLDRVHSQLRHRMDMNPSDLATLRMLVIRERRGEHVTPQEIADHLGISTASTTALLNRLSHRGHVSREPHPGDGRSRIVSLTDSARAEFFAQFGDHLGTMREVAESYSPEQMRGVTAFLEHLSDALHDALAATPEPDPGPGPNTQQTSAPHVPQPSDPSDRSEGDRP